MASAFLRSVAVEPNPESSIAQKLAATVGNSGNMLFESALASQLKPSVDEIWSLDAIPEDLDLLVLSMSNFISPATDLGRLAVAIESKRVNKVVMVGCGAQAYGFDEVVDVQPGTRRFISILHERSASIGVRGAYTADILTRLGYKNVELIGCPSIYWPAANGWPELNSKLSNNPQYGIHCTPTGKYRDVVRALFKYGMKHNATYLCQTEIAYIQDTNEVNRDFHYYMGDNVSAEKTMSYFQSNGRIFFSLDKWIRYNAGLDFVLVTCSPWRRWSKGESFSFIVDGFSFGEPAGDGAVP